MNADLCNSSMVTDINRLLRDEDRVRVRECLAWLAANPTGADNDWRQAVLSEARALGLLPPAEPPQVGCNCPRNPRPVVYGGDMQDVF